jgi:hypothetical protein
MSVDKLKTGVIVDSSFDYGAGITTSIAQAIEVEGVTANRAAVKNWNPIVAVGGAHAIERTRLVMERAGIGQGLAG